MHKRRKEKEEPNPSKRKKKNRLLQPLQEHLELVPSVDVAGGGLVLEARVRGHEGVLVANVQHVVDLPVDVAHLGARQPHDETNERWR